MMHLARSGARLGRHAPVHSALAFAAMTALGALSMQTKEIASGRDPLSLDPTTENGLRAWGKATLQGGGFGVFGDILFSTRPSRVIPGPPRWLVRWRHLPKTYWETSSSGISSRRGRGRNAFCGGRALCARRAYSGSSLWFTRLAFQRGVLDQLALMADPRARERFSRIETQAKKDWGQQYWLPPGHTEPRRAPDFGAIVGN